MPMQPTDKVVAIAISETLRLWADERYSQYLLGRGRRELEAEWFKWFIGEWRVARTIRSGQKTAALTYLNQYYPRMLKGNDDGAAVDRAAAFLRVNRISTKTADSSKHSNPISIVSKVAFLFFPTKFPPMDRYSTKGLNALRGAKRTGGVGHLKTRTYCGYLRCFRGYFRAYTEMLAAAVNERWAISYARKLDVARPILGTRRFRQKVFDNVLMQLGR